MAYRSGNGSTIKFGGSSSSRGKSSAYSNLVASTKARKEKKRKAVETKAKAAADSRGPAKGQTEQKYNQAYWADRVAKVGSAQATKEMNAVGTKKGYSGDRVVSQSNQTAAKKKLAQVTGSMATLQNGGVTAKSETSGLFGEHTTNTYDYKGGSQIVTKTTDPVLPDSIGPFSLGGLAGLRLGDKKTTTYVDGIETNVKTGGDEMGRGSKTEDVSTPAALGDTQVIKPLDLKTVADVDKQIAATTDPAALKELHKRRMQLLRGDMTRTQHSPFALGAADVARNFLMGIK